MMATAMAMGIVTGMAMAAAMGIVAGVVVGAASDMAAENVLAIRVDLQRRPVFGLPTKSLIIRRKRARYLELSYPIDNQLLDFL